MPELNSPPTNSFSATAAPTLPATTGAAATSTPRTGAISPSQSNLSPIFGPYVQQLLGQAQGLASLPFAPYTGDRFAPLNPILSNTASAAAGTGRPGQFGTASNLATMGGIASLLNSGTGIQTAPLTAYQIGPQISAANTGTVNSFMSPYMSGVIDVNKAAANREFDAQRGARNAAAVRAGAFGGSRQAIAESEAQRNLNQDLQKIQATGMQSAYDAAMAALNNERAANIDVAKANVGSLGQTQTEASRQMLEAQKMGLDSRNQGIMGALNAAQTLGGLGTAQAGADRGILGLNFDIGKYLQDYDQQDNDFGYSQWENSLNYPYKNLQFMSSMLSGLPLNVQGYQNPTQGQSGLGSALQGGLSGLALWQQLSKVFNS